MRLGITVSCFGGFVNIFSPRIDALDSVFLTAALPRGGFPAAFERLRSRSPADYAACPLLALPCLLPLAFSSERPSGRDLGRAAAALAAGIRVCDASARGGLAFAEALPREPWSEAAGIFSGIRLESPLTDAPGICLGPARADAPPSFPPFAMNRPGICVYKLAAAEGGWANGLSWTMIRTAFAKNADASNQSLGVI
jgi:hypothetical protein